MAGDEGHGSIESTDVMARTPMLAGKYQLGRLLGEGGMGAVYEATHTGLGAQVAVKLLGEGSTTDPKSIARFKREAKAMGQIRHPNVVQVMDTGADEYGLPYLVMELLDGESLSAVLRREKKLSPEAASEVAVQVLSGLGAAHAKGVIHRDLKPGNVFVAHGDDGVRRVKILDFGISKLHDSTTHNVTAEGALVGTPNFMAPEQITGAVELDHRIDIYAVGILLYRMVAGRLPYVAKAPDELYKRILAAKPKSPRAYREDLPAELEGIILKAMSPDRKNRFADVAEFQAALRDIYPTMETASMGIASRSVSTMPRMAVAAPTVAERPSAKRQEEAKKGSPGRPLLIAGGLLAAVVAAFFIIKSQGGGDTAAANAGDANANAGDAGAAAPPNYPGEALTFGIVRYLPEKMVESEIRPLLIYLSNELKRNIKLEIIPSYENLAEKVKDGEVSIAALSAYAYVLATQIDGKQPENSPFTLLAKAVSNAGRSDYSGYILSRSGSSVDSLEQLKGKTFCFVNKSSTSGYLYPRAVLRKHGIDPEKDLKIEFHQNHLDTLKALNGRSCEGAAVYDNIWLEGKQHNLPPRKFHVLAQTRRIPYDAYVVGKGMDEKTASAIRAVLLSLEYDSPLARKVFGNSEGKQIQGFTTALDSDYDGVREVAEFMDSPEQK